MVRQGDRPPRGGRTVTTHNGRRLDRIRDKLIPQHQEMKVETDTDLDGGFTLTFFGPDGKPILVYRMVGVSYEAIT